MPEAARWTIQLFECLTTLVAFKWVSGFKRLLSNIVFRSITMVHLRIDLESMPHQQMLSLARAFWIMVRCHGQSPMMTYILLMSVF